MTEEQHEALDGGNLDEEESKTDRQVIEGNAPSGKISGRELPPIVAERQQGCKDQNQSERCRLDDRRRQHEVAPIEECRPAERTSLQRAGQPPPLEEVEEVRTVVDGRCDVELVVAKECVALRPEQRDRTIEEISLIENIESVRLLACHPG